MKLNSMLKSTLGVVVLAGACMPSISVARDNTESMWNYSDGAIYENLRNLQGARMGTESSYGAQGPVRTEEMTPMWSFSDSAAYDNLRQIQTLRIETAPAGPQGPVRTEGMEAKWIYSDAATYDNLRQLMSSY